MGHLAKFRAVHPEPDLRGQQAIPYPHIEEYRAKLQELIEFGGSDNEENIRPAFQNCLDAYCHDHQERLVLIPELKNSPSTNPTAPSRTRCGWRGATGRRRTPTTTWTRR